MPSKCQCGKAQPIKLRFRFKIRKSHHDKEYKDRYLENEGIKFLAFLYMKQN